MTPLAPAIQTSDVLVSGVEGTPEPSYVTFYKAHQMQILCAVGALIALKLLK